MIEQWKELKETIIEMRDNDGTGTQQEVYKFLANLMDILEKQMQKPTTKNNLGVDCISRVYLLDDSKYHTVFNDDTGNFEDVVYREDIEKAPPIMPRVSRKGHWISHREHCEMNNLLPNGLGSYFWCSECDCGIDSKNFSRVNYNYCPNCGADMESEVEE